MSIKTRKRKLKLWKEDPHCHWCKKITILTDIKQMTGKQNPLMATLDHIFCKLDPRRKMLEIPRQNVLSCYRCNQKRGREATKLFKKQLI